MGELHSRKIKLRKRGSVYPAIEEPIQRLAIFEPQRLRQDRFDRLLEVGIGNLLALVIRSTRLRSNARKTVSSPLGFAAVREASRSIQRSIWISQVPRP